MVARDRNGRRSFAARRRNVRVAIRLESGIPFPLLDLERPRSRECLPQRMSTCELNAVVIVDSDAVDTIVCFWRSETVARSIISRSAKRA